MMNSNQVTESLLKGKFLINLNNLVSAPMRTGIQRVCYEFCARWPYIDDTIPFVELGMDRIGILGPDFFQDIYNLFEETDDILSSVSEQFSDIKMETSPGWVGLISARNRVLFDISAIDALENCRAVISLEESLNIEFYSVAAQNRPEKIFNLCHDFLVWTHSEFFGVDWRSADNINLSLENRRKYTNNFFTSTATREQYVTRINRGDRREYAVIPPGADGLGRTYRTDVPAVPEFVVVGTLEPRKQPIHILEAFERLQSEGQDARLCFAGRMGWLQPADKERLIEAFATYPWLRWVDGPDDEILRDLVQNSRATIYLSEAEGFGSPPVESLALGVPCIVSAVIPSVLDMENNGQIRIMPDDGEALVAAVRRLLDEREVAALQQEIETLNLPTWRDFVAGIADLVDERAPAVLDKGEVSLSYAASLSILRTLGQMWELDRSLLIEQLLKAAKPDVTGKEITHFQSKAEMAGWSNVDTVLQVVGSLPPGSVPPCFVQQAVARKLDVRTLLPENSRQWQVQYQDLMEEPDFYDFMRRIYLELLDRAPDEGEIERYLPPDESRETRLVWLRSAIGSDEYRRRMTSRIQASIPAGYLARVKPASIIWQLHALDSLAAEAAVARALLIADDAQFLKIASFDLTGQTLSRAEHETLTRLLRGRHGRYLVLLRLLVSRACLLRVKDARVHLGLIRRMAVRARIVQPARQDALAVAAKVNQVLALPHRSVARNAFPLFFGDDHREPEHLAIGLLGANADNEMLAAALVLYGMLAGEFQWSGSLLSWASPVLCKMEMAGKSRSGGTGRERPVDLFLRFLARDPAESEQQVLTDAIADGLDEQVIADALRILALRRRKVAELLEFLFHFAKLGVALAEKADCIEALVEKFEDAEPAREPQRFEPQIAERMDSAPSPATEQGENAFMLSSFHGGEVVTVDQLMAFDNQDFIRMAYRKLLLREVDSSGMATYEKALRTGQSKAAVIYSLANSNEGRAAQANLIGLEELVRRQSKLRRWPVRKLIRFYGLQL